MNLFERAIRELKEESEVVVSHLQFWWNGMSLAEQAFALAMVSAGFILLGVIQPTPKATNNGYETSLNSGLAKQFAFAVVILLLITFGIDIAIENLR